MCGALSPVSVALNRPDLSCGMEKQSVAIPVPPIASFQNFLSSTCPSRSKDELRTYCIPHGRDISVPRLVIVVVTLPTLNDHMCSVLCQD